MAGERSTLEHDRGIQSLPARSSSPSSQQHQKSQRTLACVLCQQRKVKCDRTFPCANCVRAKVSCVPASLVPRQRKRRFPERQLLDRIRHYESILRENNIEFEPLHKRVDAETATPHLEAGNGADDEPSPSTTSKSDDVYQVKNIWQVMGHDYRVNDDESGSETNETKEDPVKDALFLSFENSDSLLFGSPQTISNLSTLHPGPVQIFQLWQIYLDNVNPLLKVTHTPSMQPRVIEAASNLKSIDANLEALMFGIYCMSTFSLSKEECESIFNESKENLLSRYQFGCQQALIKASYSRSTDRDCLTGFFLYLITHRPRIDPRSVHSMLGVAIRMAQRMGLHSESMLQTRRSALEAELGRRLWWSLILFDARIGESADCRVSSLEPTWDCRVPLNVNETDLRAEMKEMPLSHRDASDAIFAVVRCELGQFLRHAEFHLDFTSPAHKSLAREHQSSTVPKGKEIVMFEKYIENRHLRFCDPGNPLHHLTIWTARSFIARFKLMELYWKLTDQRGPRTDEQRDELNFHAIRYLECDSKIVEIPETKGFLWLADAYFPLPAYLQVISDLKRRPTHTQAAQFWEIISQNFTRRWTFQDTKFSRILKVFSDMVFEAWTACEKASTENREPMVVPKIVSYLRSKQPSPVPPKMDIDDIMETGFDDLQLPRLTDFGDVNILYNMTGQDHFPQMTMMGESGLSIQPMADLSMDQFNWAAMDWSLMDPSTGASPQQAVSTGPSLPDQTQTSSDVRERWMY